jgi:hypothetical protein
MTPMFERLESVKWASLHHAYGTAEERGSSHEHRALIQSVWL